MSAKEENSEIIESPEAEAQEEGAVTGETIGTLPSKLGTIRIADNVVATITGVAAGEIEGVVRTSSRLTGGLARTLGRKKDTRGVKVDVGEEEAVININLIVKYGIPIAEVARKVQQNVKEKIEDLTGLKVKEVTINVQGMEMPRTEPEGKVK